MEKAQALPARTTGSHLWWRRLLNLAPLWLILMAVSAEGFPAPPFDPLTASPLLVTALTLSAILLVKRWMSIEMLLYCLLPIGLAMQFDEITTTYKTPFIFATGAGLSIGALIALSLPERYWRVLVLVIAALACVLLARHAADNFWELHSALGVGQCFLDQAGCPALPADAPSWWQLFFGL